jgi:hypothetical protein
MEACLHAHPTRSYRCYYTPLDRDGFPVVSESGILPFLQLKATSAEHAQIAAHAIRKCPVAYVERLEEAAPAKEPQL